MEKKENILTIPAAIVIAGLIVAAAIMYTRMPAAVIQKGAPAVQAGAININPVTANDHLRGSPDAEVTLIEFSDLECPFCKAFHATMQAIMEEYGKTGKVAWVYRHFPLSIHPKNQKEAVASECAWEQGGDDMFWRYIDKLFSVTPSNNGLDPAELPAIASELGLDMTRFNACLASTKYDDKIQKEYQDGIRVGIGSVADTGTPYSVLIDKHGNKVPLNGAQPYQVVKQLIDAMLAQ